MGQVDIFSIMYPKYKITKPIRLIELFSGYGSQAIALKYLGVKFEHWKTCEWAIKSIQAYKDIHFINDDTNYSKDLSKEEIIDYLFKKGISSNYNNPMGINQINRMQGDKLRQIYNNIIATNNLVNIQQVKGKDLEIVDADKYDYIMTYSFPCQDLSLAGLGKGMSRDSGTRSGMLWEVERILDECENLPQILLMENVPEVKGTNNVKYFNEWQHKLESLGYKNYHQNLIATDYGIPQTRNRTFMVSILGNYSYTFPQPIPLELKLKDMLEDNVDEKYYLSDKQINDITNWKAYQKPLETMEQVDKTSISPTLTTRSGAYAAGMVLVKDTENYIEWEENGRLDIDCRAFKEPMIFDDRDKGLNGINITNMCPTQRATRFGLKVIEATKKGYAEATNGDGVYINRPHQKRGVVQKGKIQTLKTSPDTGVVVNDIENNNLLLDIFGLCGIIDIKEIDKYERSKPLLSILWREITKEEIWEETRRFVSIQEKEILQSNLYENGIYEDRKLQSKVSASTSNSSEYNESITNREEMLNMWGDWKTRYTPQRWELSEQQFRQFNLFMQELSYETTQRETSMQNMWQTNERFRILQQTLFKIQEIWRPIENKISNGLRVRKLTPRETFRLMGVKDEDYENCAKNQSDSSLYHLAGDSIVVNVLMAIFKELIK